MNDQRAVKTFLFTDIEGSSRLWEAEPERMGAALARHNVIVRDAVTGHRGAIVKSTGDGFHAAFDDPRDALSAAVALQLALADAAPGDALALKVRCGIHAGVSELANDDYYGAPVNRAARIMNAAHGGQVIVSKVVADLVARRLPGGVSLRELGSVRLRDLVGSERLYQVEHPKLRREFPPLRSLEASPNNLPQQTTSFIGRERELDEVKAELANARLVTLTGIGGLGKTRLSLQVAADVAHHYPDGVWFVELAPLGDEQLVAQAVATVLGVQEESGRSITEALVQHVRDRTLLVVLDNCEHLVHACATLAARLLEAAPRLRILASSRERLNIAGEVVHTVPPLSIAKADADASAASIVECEAVRLFVDRAMAMQSQFRLDDANAAAVAEICRRVDGIPLALELAAARVRALGVHEIAARVTDRFRLLTSGHRTASPRQQTLRAAIDWSYELLTSRQQQLFCRLAVFAGGWTLDAAEAVAAGDGIAEADVLDLLAELVDKSLVSVQADAGRYAFLETVRQYAEERLAVENGSDDVRRRYVAFYLAFAEKSGSALAGPDQQRWLAAIDAERENVLAAHAWCAELPDGAELDCRLVAAIKLYWFTRGLLDLGRKVTVEALALPNADSRSPARCRALWVAGQICSYSGRYEEAQRYLGESLDIAQRNGDRRMIASVRNYLSLAALGNGDRAAARHHSEQALALAQEEGSKREVAVASNALAQLKRLDDDYDGARVLYEQAVRLGDELSDREFAAIGLLGLAMVAVARAAPDVARGLLGRVLEIAESTGSTPAKQSALEVAVGLAALTNRPALAARLYGAAEAQKARTGIGRDPADEAFLQPFVDGVRRELGASFADAEKEGRELTLDAAVAEASSSLIANDAGDRRGSRPLS